MAATCLFGCLNGAFVAEDARMREEHPRTTKRAYLLPSSSNEAFRGWRAAGRDSHAITNNKRNLLVPCTCNFRFRSIIIASNEFQRAKRCQIGGNVCFSASARCRDLPQHSSHLLLLSPSPSLPPSTLHPPPSLSVTRGRSNLRSSLFPPLPSFVPLPPPPIESERLSLSTPPFLLTSSSSPPLPPSHPTSRPR